MHRKTTVTLPYFKSEHQLNMHSSCPSFSISTKSCSSYCPSCIALDCSRPKGQNVLAEKLRQYGTDGTDGRDWKEGRMRKAKSWYGGMDSADFDYDPVDETDEPIGEETDERPSSPDAERLDIKNRYILLDILLCSKAGYFHKVCSILANHFRSCD